MSFRDDEDFYEVRSRAVEDIVDGNQRQSLFMGTRVPGTTGGRFVKLWGSDLAFGTISINEIDLSNFLCCIWGHSKGSFG